jgi:putative FmdB family regulatory protein
MPIYEYDCGECKHRVSIFFPSFSAVEARTATGENRCPRCGSADLTRRMSRVRTLRSVGSGASGDMGASGDDDDDMMGDMGGLAAGLEGLDENDPRAVARWARQMKETMGDDMDMGPDFDRALARIESGEDPERVMEDLDPEALGGNSGDEALDDADFDDV